MLRISVIAKLMQLHFMLKLTKLLFVALSISLLSACTTYQPEQPLLVEEHEISGIMDSYGKLNDRELNTYLSALIENLTTATNLNNSNNKVEVTLLNTDQPLAITSSALRHILISAGVVKKLDNEAQLAFLLAHELSHIALKHRLPDKQALNLSMLSEYQKKSEQAADDSAIKIILLLGYDPNEAVKALAYLYQVEGSDSSSFTSHPQFSTRALNLLHQIALAKWRSPGVTTSRSFYKFKKTLTLYY